MIADIRKATIHDIHLIQNLAYVTWPVAYRKVISSDQIEYMLDKMYSQESLEHQFYEGVQFLIADVEEEAVGFASFSILEGYTYKLHKLYVNPEKQQVGAGKALLKEVIARVINLGGKKLQLQVNRKNKSVGFYEKMGFAIIKEQDFYFGNDYYMNDYIMELDL